MYLLFYYLLNINWILYSLKVSNIYLKYFFITQMFGSILFYINCNKHLIKCLFFI